MTMHKRKKSKCRIKKDNIFILILILILIALIIWLVMMAKDILKKNNTTVKETQVVDKLDNFDYYLTDNNTKYYKELFEELKTILNTEPVDDEKYASGVAKLFTADFYDLNSKLSKSDVGGVQFIQQDYQDVFVKTASDSNGIYYYVKSDLYGDRKQDLPEVKKVEVTSIKNTTYKHDKINDPKAYLVTVAITYEKDLGYPKTVSLTLVHNDKKIEIVEVK